MVLHPPPHRSLTYSPLSRPLTHKLTLPVSGGGYVGRLFSSADKLALIPFLINTLFLLVAPALFAASIYIILGRLMVLVDGAKYSVVPVNWVTKLFVAGDVLSFLMQSAGGGLLGSKKMDMMDMGEKLIIAGLFVQIGFFGFFMVVTVIFHLRLRKNPTPTSETLMEKPRIHSVFKFRKTWKLLLNVLYITSALILVRSVFRAIEYIQGHDGYLIRHEVFLYIFDSMLMAWVVVAFNVVHPTDILEGEQEDRTGMEML